MGKSLNAFTGRLRQRAAQFSLSNVRNCTEIYEVNPFGGTNFQGPASVFVRVFLHLLAGEGVWERGRHLSPHPQQPFRGSSWDTYKITRALPTTHSGIGTFRATRGI